MASASSSSPFHGIRDREEQLQNQMKTTTTPPDQLQQQSSSSAPAKKRRSQPGNPNPDAEVIALSPTTLMATNRFVCEVCNKGFQREQNLQLHRRGHNLPWKLRLKSSKDPPRRKVYLCPEPSCVHHDPARALGDLTGIKKHFCRKHGEKKWKCDKCAKRYAVHSDLKAHAKTCGTREYRCDCGTLFSRRDSFITHRAFCDALAQESTRLAPPAGGVNHIYGSNMMAMAGLRDQSNDVSSSAAAAQFQQLVNPLSGSSPGQFRSPPTTASFYLGNGGGGGGGVQDFNVEEQSLLQRTKPFHGLMQLPDLQANASSSNFFNLGFFSNNNAVVDGGAGGASADPASFFSGNLIVDGPTMASPSLYDAESSSSVHPRMSATSLLQRAAQMGSTTSGGGPLLLSGFGGGGAASSSCNPKPPPPSFGGNLDAFHPDIDNVTSLQNIMNALEHGGAAGAGLFSGVVGFNEGAQPRHDSRELTSFVTTGALDKPDHDTKFNLAGGGGGSDHLTRDFLGVGGMARSIGGGAAAAMSLREQIHGMDMSMLDPK